MEEKDLKFIFFSAKKQNPYRVFPKNNNKYELPVILRGSPLPPNDFLIISSNPPTGTPRPVLYTLMKNTTDFSDEDILNKVIPQVISLSMLCWESPMPTSQPLPLHYADKLAEFTQKTGKKWNSFIKYPLFI